MSNTVEDFYAELGQGEWDRLDTPYFQIGHLSTLSLIDKYLPHGGHILDLGGGPGRYTIELLKRDMRVTLVDLSAELVGLADQRLKTLNLTPEALLVGDARDLSRFNDHSFDALLIMGPLYHLAERSDRLQVLIEARRVLKLGGRALVTYLNSWGLLRTGLRDFPDRYQDPAFVQAMFHEGGLGIWYWSNPKLAAQELSETGFQVLTYAGMEGFVANMAESVDQMATNNPRAYDNVVQAVISSMETAPFRDITDHLNFVIA